MLYCEKDGIVPVSEKDLPVILPENVDITSDRGSPLGRVPEFVNAICPNVAAPHDARPTPWTRLSFVLVLLSLHRRPQSAGAL